MHKRLLLTTLAVGLAAVASVVPASAMATQEIKAHIPFSFEVANTVLPAGDYTITPMGIDDPSVLVLHSADNKTSIQFLTVATTPEGNLKSAELVFDHLGKNEFLRDVLVPGDASAQLPVSHTEHRAETAAMTAAEQHPPTHEHAKTQ